MLDRIYVAGEVKWIDYDVKYHYLDTERWKACPCCDEVFAPIQSSTDWEELEDGACHWVTWTLKMPITRSWTKYCCDFCRHLYNRHHREKAKETEAVRLLKEDWMARYTASKLVDELGIKLKNTVRNELPDYEHIFFQGTYIYKFHKGLWRICSNPECPNRSRIYYTERRKWQIQRRSQTSEPQYEPLGEDRLIRLLDVDYEPKLVNMKWRFCSARCRVAYKREEIRSNDE